MIEIDVDFARGDFRLKTTFQSSARLTALFGRSGAGKSTVIALIAGLARPDRGRIVVAGRTLVDTQAGVFVPSAKRRIGLVFQDANLFPHMTVRQNLAFGRLFTPRRERRIPFDPVVETLGIGALLDRRPVSLSGGERQRVAIGRALLASPRLLLMDEPLASLDRPRKLEILPLIEQLRDEFAIPIVYVSHAVEEVARIAGTVVVMEMGGISAVGPPDTVLYNADGVDRLQLASIISAMVEGFDARYGLTRLAHPAGTLYLPGRVGRTGEVIHVAIRASDVTLAADPPTRMTVQTVLKGTILRLRDADGALAKVDITIDGGGRLVAFATRMGLDALGRGVGQPVYALIKAVALDERAGGDLNA